MGRARREGRTGRFLIESAKSIAGVAPGQFGVVYDTERGYAWEAE